VHKNHWLVFLLALMPNKRLRERLLTLDFTPIKHSNLNNKQTTEHSDSEHTPVLKGEAAPAAAESCLCGALM